MDYPLWSLYLFINILAIINGLLCMIFMTTNNGWKGRLFNFYAYTFTFALTFNILAYILTK